MRSDNVTKGSERAPTRSLFYALGYTPEELDRPLIGVVSAYSEIVPGHMNLDKRRMPSRPVCGWPGAPPCCCLLLACATALLWGMWA